jgi:hypothetical protein
MSTGVMYVNTDLSRSVDKAIAKGKIERLMVNLQALIDSSNCRVTQKA